MTRPFPQRSVIQWLEDAEDHRLYLSVITLGEVSKGIATLPESKRRNQLQRWLTETLRPWFQGRILPVDESIAARWGPIAGKRKLSGKPLKVEDGLIEATALQHDLTVVTQNVKDSKGLGVDIFDPWR